MTVDQNGSGNITLTGDAARGDPLTFRIVSGPTNGGFTGTAPALTYQPGAGYYGSDSFTFVVSNGYSESASVTVSISVTQINQPPIAQDDYYPTADGPAANEGEAFTIEASDLLANDSPGAGEGNQLLTVTSVGTPAHGTADLSNNQIVYTPETDYVGDDEFIYTIQDNGTPAPLMSHASVHITVNRVNQAPVIDPIADQTVVVAQSFSLTPTATDREGDTLVWNLSGTTPFGLNFDSSTGTLSGTPAQPGALTLTATDNGTPNRSSNISFNITVNAVGGTGTGTGTGTSSGTGAGGSTGSNPHPHNPHSGVGLRILKEARRMYGF